MMNVLKSDLVVLALMIACTYAAVNVQLQQGNNCRYTRKTVTRTQNSVHIFSQDEVYGPGAKWLGRECEHCSCSTESYKNLWTCYLPAAPDTNVMGIPTEYNITIPYNPPPYCCNPMQRLTSAKADVEADMYLTYRMVDYVALTCATAGRVTIIPAGCIEITGPKPCTFKIVKASDPSQPCDAPLTAVG